MVGVCSDGDPVRQGTPRCPPTLPRSWPGNGALPRQPAQTFKVTHKSASSWAAFHRRDKSVRGGPTAGCPPHRPQQSDHRRGQEGGGAAPPGPSGVAALSLHQLQTCLLTRSGLAPQPPPILFKAKGRGPLLLLGCAAGLCPLSSGDRGQRHDQSGSWGKQMAGWQGDLQKFSEGTTYRVWAGLGGRGGVGQRPGLATEGGRAPFRLRPEGAKAEGSQPRGKRA